MRPAEPAVMPGAAAASARGRALPGAATLGAPRWWLVLAGYLVALGAGWGYGRVVQASGAWNQGAPWERALLLQVHAEQVGWLGTILYVIPWAGTNLTLGPLVAVVAGWLVWRRRRDLATWLVVVELGVLSLNWLLKTLLERERPHLFERVGWFGWASYPSGHVMSGLAVLMTFAILARRATGRQWPLVAAFATCCAIAYSRLVHGVHWPTDLVGGAITGVIWLLFTWAAFVAWPASPRDDGGAVAHRE